MKTPLLAAAAALLCATAHADTAPADGSLVISPMAGFAFTNGGDPIIHLTIYNIETGVQMDTDTIKAGSKDLFTLGAELRRVGAPYALQATIGYQWHTTTGINGNITFSRMPIELLGMVNVLPALRFGAGLHYDTRVYLNGKGVLEDSSLKQRYRNALGGVVKGEWMITPDTGIEVRYARVSYKLKSVDGTPIDAIPGGDQVPALDGRSLGLGLNAHF